jgi:hypothetical protein
MSRRDERNKTRPRLRKRRKRDNACSVRNARTERGMNKREQRRRQIKAVHEAGHAVAHVMLGMDFDYATIVANEDSGGHVAMTRPDDVVEMWNCGDRDNPRVRDFVERELIATFAGHIAQRRAFPRSHWQYGFGVMKSPGGFIPEGKPVAIPGSDIQTVIRIIDDLHGHDGDAVRFAYHAYVEARAEALVRQHIKQIEAVAAALLKHDTLTADAIRAIMFPDDLLEQGAA